MYAKRLEDLSSKAETASSSKELKNLLGKALYLATELVNSLSEEEKRSEEPSDLAFVGDEGIK